MFVLVWAYEQEHKKFTTQDVFVPWHLQDNFEAEAAGSKGKKVGSQAEDSSFIDTGIKNKDK